MSLDLLDLFDHAVLRIGILILMRRILSVIANRINRLLDLMVIGDKITVLVMIVTAAFLVVVTPRLVGVRATGIEIISRGAKLGQFSLDSNRLLDVDGPLGRTQIQIRDGKARIIDSPCSNRYCIQMGPVGESGGIIVCVPNEIIVQSVKQRDDGLDAVSK